MGEQLLLPYLRCEMRLPRKQHHLQHLHSHCWQRLGWSHIDYQILEDCEGPAQKLRTASGECEAHPLTVLMKMPSPRGGGKPQPSDPACPDTPPECEAQGVAQNCQNYQMTSMTFGWNCYQNVSYG